MSRWRDPLPSVDWRQWWYAYIAHFLTGALAGLGVTYGGEAAVYFVVIPALVVARQTLEFLRRNDTPGRDLGQHIAGFCVGIGIPFLTRVL